MPTQYLYPTGINQNWNNWVNHSGHSYTNTNVYFKDIDEGVPGNSGDYLSSSTPYGSYAYIIDAKCGPLAIDPEKVIFRGVYYYSGTAFDTAPSPNRIVHYFSLYDSDDELLSLTSVTDNISVYNQGWKEISIQNELVDRDFNGRDMTAQWQLHGYNTIGGFQVPTTRHLISSFEVQVSGDNVKTSGIPLLLAGYPRKNTCIKPEAYAGLSNKWHQNYDLSGVFDQVYTRMETGSGLIVYSENNNVSGVYYVTAQGNSSGLLWHNKRLSLNYDQTYEHAPKFNSVDDSAIVFNSGIMFNKTNFTVLSRYFPSGESFVSNGSGYFTILNNSTQNPVLNYNWRVECSDYQSFSLTMYDSSNVRYSVPVSIDARRGFDLMVSYGDGTAGLYIQNHDNGIISSGIMSISNLLQDHRHKLSIGGILASGV
jgi:hypothetical protein